MSRGLIVLDVQHQLRSGMYRNDLGAVFKFQDGTRVTEVELARHYAHRAAGVLARLGFDVIHNADGNPARTPLVGSYAHRAEVAHVHGAMLYLACHVNAGRGRYALAEVLGAYPDEGPGSPAVQSVGYAKIFLEKLHADALSPATVGFDGRDVPTQIRKLSPFPLYRPTPSSPLRFERGRGCISRALELGVPAVLLEPFFIDNPAHLNLFAHSSIVGNAIAEAVPVWLDYVQAWKTSRNGLGSPIAPGTAPGSEATP